MPDDARFNVVLQVGADGFRTPVTYVVDAQDLRRLSLAFVLRLLNQLDDHFEHLID